MSDAVNKPTHYNQGPIECIDAMQQILTPEEFRGFLKGNAFKYLWREKGKNGIEDLRKGKDYYDRLIQSFDESEDQPVIKQSLTTEPPDGWRWLKVGEVIRKGDRYFKDHEWHSYDLWVGAKITPSDRPSIRRNKFKVGEKVVDFCGQVWEVEYIFDTGNRYRLKHKEVRDEGYGNNLAPYIEVTVEVTPEVTGEVKPPDGWRFLEVGEVIRKGDLPWADGWVYATESIMLGMALPKHWKPIIRRNKFEVGEKVVHVPSEDILEVVEVVEVAGDVKVADIRGSVSRYYPEVLAPYIEETK